MKNATIASVGKRAMATKLIGTNSDVFKIGENITGVLDREIEKHRVLGLKKEKDTDRGLLSSAIVEVITIGNVQLVKTENSVYLVQGLEE